MAGPPGFFLVIDGPNSVDTSTVAKLVGATLARCGYPVTIARKPSAGLLVSLPAPLRTSSGAWRWRAWSPRTAITI